MRRAIFVALGTGAIITGAAAIGFDSKLGATPAIAADDDIAVQRARSAARELRRDIIEQRYLAARAKCEVLGGARRDRCLVDTHAARGRALLEEHGPYQLKS